MGQYFKFINFDKKEMISPYTYDNLAKVMEHSYQENKYMAAAEKLMNTTWKGDRVLYLGDYVDSYYEQPKFKDILESLVKEVREEKLFENSKKESLYFVKFKERKIEISDNELLPTRYIYNKKTNEYIDLKKQIIQWSGYYKGEIWGAKIHPLSLLLCASNGDGGSYYGINMDYVGHWVNYLGDIGFSDTALSNYEELPVIFDERNTSKSNIEILKETIKEAIDDKKILDSSNIKFAAALFLNENEINELQNYAKEYFKQNEVEKVEENSEPELDFL